LSDYTGQTDEFVAGSWTDRLLSGADKSGNPCAERLHDGLGGLGVFSEVQCQAPAGES
jgi:hypothetical protein